MYSFIPAWYSDSGMVKAASFWASYTDGMEFDDTVNQLRIFNMAGEETELLLLGCVPDLRHFMHRQGIEDTSVWSAFDVIQNIRLRAPGLLSYLDFKWPREIEWFNTPFLTAGFIGDKLLVKVYYGIGGHTVRLEWFENNVLFRSYEIDDRGFISYRTIFEEGKAVRRVYYSDRLKPRVTENLLTGRVNVCPDAAGCFARSSYDSMGDLVEEVLCRHLQSVKDGNKREIIAAYDERHNSLVLRAAKGMRISTSVFSRRNDAASIPVGDKLIASSAAVVTDTEHLAEKVRSVCPERADSVMDISPYDARLSPGASGNIRELKLLFYVSDWNDASWRNRVEDILRFMRTSPNTMLTLGLGRGCAGRVSLQTAENELAAIMEKLGLDFAFEQPKNGVVIENEDEPEVQERLFIRNCSGEMEMMELMSDHRLVIDVSPEPDLYLQIAGVSACIPMILSCESRYVSHRENGWVLSSENDMTAALRYFLDGLANWNRAFVASLGKISQYTDGSLVARWKQAMNTAD